MTDIAPRYSHERLSALIDAQGLRLDWFAEQLGLHMRGEAFDPSYVSKLRAGAKPITPEIATAAARILRVPVDLLTVVPEPVEVPA